MTRNQASRPRTGRAAVVATTIVALAVLALGNQALQSWRTARAGSSNHWIADLFQPLALAGWRLSPGSGPNAAAHWLAPIVFDVVFVVLTALLTATALHNRTRRGPVFLSAWEATCFAGAGAGIATTTLAYTGVGIPTADAYRTTLAEGLVLGFLVGLVAALAAALLTGGTRSASAATALDPPPVATDPGDSWPLTTT